MKMIDILDVLAVPVALVLMGLLTIPVIRTIRRRAPKSNLMSAGWVLTVFIICFIPVVNLSFKYFSVGPMIPFVTVNLSGPALLIFSSSFLVDALSLYILVMFVGIGAVVTLYSALNLKKDDDSGDRYIAIMVLVVGCLIGATLAGDLLTLFIFWEAASAGSSFLMLYKKSPASVHATLKFLVMIVIGSSFIVYGLSLLFSIAGTLNFWEVKNVLVSFDDKALLLVAFAFIAGGYAIEAAVVPFHVWLPDAYTEAPASSSSFLSGLVDQGSYYILLRVFIYILTPTQVIDWTTTVAIFAMITMVVGNLRALMEENIKRLIAYVCVADVGYNLIAISSMTSLGVMANLFFFLVGGITTALAFMAVGILNSMGFRTIDDFNGIGKEAPLTSLGLTIGLLSFAGIPPFAGFIAKYLLFTSAIEGGIAWLAVVGVTVSVVQAAYLLRLLNRMYGKPASEGRNLIEPRGLLAPILAFGALLIVLGLFPTIALTFIQPVVQELPLMP
jgi:proton-translocating NADH-quinone oxidoreductase chain N